MNVAIVNSLINRQNAKDPELASILREFLSGLQELFEVTTLDNNEFIEGKNAAGNNQKIIGLNNLNQIRLGESKQAKASGEYHIYVPSVNAADLPPASSGLDGLIVCDLTNARFCFYINSARYFLTKTAF